MSFREEMMAAYYKMLDLKEALGYNRKTYKFQIIPFIDYCADNFPASDEITKEMLDNWLLFKKFETDNTRKHAIINIRHFARYLNAVGKKAYVPTEEYNIRIQRYYTILISLICDSHGKR